MAKKKVCCSFDYEHDRIYYNLLEAWNENDDINFSINDCTPSEIQSESVSTIKQVLSTKIGRKLMDLFYNFNQLFLKKKISRS